MRKSLIVVLACMLALAVCYGCASNGNSSQSGQSSAASSTAATSASASSDATSASASASSGAVVSSSVVSSTAPSNQSESYTITRVEQAPDWSAIPQLDIDNVQWTDDYGIRAHAQLCYDDKAIYVHMWADEQDVRATYTADDPLPKCYEDSCLELFLAPVATDARYLNFEFNPNCAVCCEVGVEKANRVKLIPEEGTFAATSSPIDGGWGITYQLPFEFIRTLYPDFVAESGQQIRGNLYKCGNLTTHKHYLTWNLVDSDTPNFHVPSSFGALVFG